MKTRIQVPLTLPEPHFEDEATVVSARQVVPLGQARVQDGRRKLFATLPLLLAAIFCGALGAIGVNYFERRVSAPTVSTPPTRAKEEVQQTAPAPSLENSAVASADPQDERDASEPSGSALVSNPSARENAENQTTKSDEAVASVKKPSSPPDPKQIVRPRRVHPPASPGSQDDQPKSRGASKIQDIFGGPNP